MTPQIDTKFEGKLTCASKNDMTNLANFHQSTWKSQNWDFDGMLLSKVEDVWAQNFQGSYVSWKGGVLQNLKGNWIVSSKLTLGIWRILTRALGSLKNLHFNGMLLTKVCNVWAKRRTEELCLMALKIDAKFEGKLTCHLKNDMTKIANFC